MLVLDVHCQRVLLTSFCPLDLLLKKRLWQLQKPRGFRPPPPPPPPRRRHPLHQEVHPRHSREEDPLPHHPGQPHPPHTHVALEVDKLR